MLKRFFFKNGLALFFLFAPLSFLISQNSQDQSSSNSFLSWLKTVEESYEISFSYNPALLEQLQFTIPNDCSSIESCIELAQKQLPIKFETIEENHFLIIPIRSKVRFKAMEEGGEVPIFSLVVQVNDQPKKYLLPDTDGFYEISELFPTDSLRLSSNFHKTQKLSVADLAALKNQLFFTSTTILLNEVVVKDYMTSGVDVRLTDHSLQINLSKLGLLPGETDNDIFTLLKTIPGIRTPDGKPGSLNFRGTTFDQTMILFDEIPIYHSGHFLGTISPYNPLVVDQVEIYRGILPSKWGGRVGGLINIQSEDPLIDSASYTLMSNTIYGGAKIKIPLIDNKLGLLLSARSNYPIEQLSPRLKALSVLNFQGSKIGAALREDEGPIEDTRIGFQDVNGKLVYQFNEDHQASVSFLGIVNKFNFDLKSPRLKMLETENISLNNWGITGKWNGKLSSKVNGKLSITQSRLNILNEQETEESGARTEYINADNQLKDTKIVSEANINLSPNLSIDAGYTLNYHQLYFKVESLGGPPLREENQESLIHSVHIATRQYWGSRITANIGLRGDYFQPLNRQFFDPRFSMSFIANKGITLKASAGRTHQYLYQEYQTDFDDFRINNQFWLLSDSDENILESSQAMLGGLFQLPGWLFDVELYRREIHGVDRDNRPNRTETGSFKTIGADLFVKRKWDKIETWASYSISHVQTDFDAVETAFFDQRHIFNITGILNLNRWNIATSWGFLSGMPVIIPAINPNHPNSNGESVLVVPYTERYPAQHQLDFSAIYRLSKPRSPIKTTLGLSIVNLYNQNNIINIFQRDPRVDDPFRYALGITPDLHLNISF